MALADRTTWEIRPTGNASNGGGYDPSVAAPGTDYSQQDAQQVTIDNVTITTSITTNVITFSGGYIPTAFDPGNLVHMLTGTNVTAGFYVINSQTPTTWVMDRNVVTAGTTVNATGRMGGAVATLLTIQGVLTDGNTVWIKAGTGYSTNTQWAPLGSGTDGKFNTFQGYTTTRGDNGLATITATANLSPVFQTAAQQIVRNLTIDGALTADRGIDWSTLGYMENCWVKNCNFSGARAQNLGTRVNRCLFTGNGAGAAAGVGLDVGNAALARACEAHNNKQGFTSSNGMGGFEYCVSYNNTGSGFYQQGANGMRIRNCVADGNAVDGLTINDASGALALEVTNCLFSNNTGRGIRSVGTDYSTTISAPMAAFFQNNAFYNNTAGNYNRVPAGASDILLTLDPYTSRATFDFSLNSTTGAGLSLQGAGIPGGYGVLGTGTLNSTGHLDIGAVQGLAAASGGTALSGMRSLWREYTNERNSIVVPDVTVDIYLQSGLEALNRRVRYHWTDSTVDVTLLAGVQEYTLPSDIVELVWLEWNGFEVAKTSMDQLRSRLVNWRNQKAGPPQEWLFYKNKLVLIPAPDAATVATASHPVFRYVNTPPSITTNGPEQLSSQDYRVPVYHGVAEWASAHPDSALATLRAQSFKSMFETEADTIASQYDSRLVAR